MYISHSYIIEYPKGKRRDALLEQWVQKLIATKRRVGPNEHEDVHYMECSGKLGYKVSDADSFIESLMMMPHGTLSVGIINDAESMSEVVQNKLLKTIEEPAARTVVVLVTSNRNSLLQTIRSRCTLLKLDDGSDNRKISEPLNPEDDRGMEAFYTSEFFYEFRKIIEKEINSREEAINFIDKITLNFRDALINNVDCENAIYGIEKAEELRTDIMRGMGYMHGLKRFYLELHAENK